MGLDATTFVLEVINFLVLLWLLTRFLYRPLTAAMARRQQAAAEAAARLDARATGLEQQAAALAAQQATLAAGAEAARQQLAGEISAERQRRLQALDADMAAARAQAEARLAAWREQQQRGQAAAAERLAESFLRGWLQRLAGPALERQIGELFLADLAALPENRRRALAAGAGASVEIATAYAPEADFRARVEAALAACLGPLPAPRWVLEPGLIAGLSLRLDGHLLEASLARALVDLQGGEAA